MKEKTSQSNEGNAVSGLAFLMDYQNLGQAPAAFERLLGFRLEQVSKGQVRLVAEPAAECINPMDTLHGGYIAALLDAAMSASAHSLLEAGKTFTTIEMKVNFMKAVRGPFDAINAHGAVRRSGRRLAFVEGYVYSGANELIASGSGTCLIWDSSNNNEPERKGNDNASR